MAFKRMWTEEEIKDTYFLNIDYFEDDANISITKELFEKIVSKNILCVTNSDNEKSYYYVVTEYINGDEHQKFYESDTGFNHYTIGVVHEGGSYYALQLGHNRTINDDDFENLVRVTPTDVSIIEDEGKLELMLEHDGNVLSVNDTPNQFLQRRLDKPSVEWNRSTSSEDFGTWLQEQLPNMYVGQYVYLRDAEIDEDMFFILVSKNATRFTLKPIFNVNYGGYVYQYTFIINESEIAINIYENADGITLSFNDAISMKLF